MVASSSYYFCAAHWNFADHRLIQSGRSIYLYTVLIMSRNRASETVLTITLGFIVLYLIRDGAHPWMLYAALIIGVMGLFWKWMRFRIHDLWFQLTEILGFFISRLVLSLVFFFVVVPFGFLSRLFRKDLMYLKRNKKSYFRQRSHLFSAQDLENPW